MSLISILNTISCNYNTCLIFKAYCLTLYIIAVLYTTAQSFIWYVSYVYYQNIQHNPNVVQQTIIHPSAVWNRTCSCIDMSLYSIPFLACVQWHVATQEKVGGDYDFVMWLRFGILLCYEPVMGTAALLLSPPFGWCARLCSQAVFGMYLCSGMFWGP